MTTSLREKITQTTVAFRAQVPAEALSVIDTTTSELEESGIADNSLKVGESAPVFSLPNQRGEVQNLPSLLAKGRVVISFYRGGWCPYCNLELAALQAVLPDIEAAGASLIAITPELPDSSLTTAEKNGLSFDILTDEGNEVAKSFGLEFELSESLRPIYASFGLDIPAHNGDKSFKLPLPATYVIDSDGSVLYQFSDADYTKRLEPSEILSILA
ncbi:MAG: peroxiredoxin [Flavobacteriales bacterium]|jgi:peroxiredoxin